MREHRRHKPLGGSFENFEIQYALLIGNAISISSTF